MEGKFCPSCTRGITNANRLITESCGHLKCRYCFISEESICVQCSKFGLDVQIVENILISPKQTKLKTKQNTVKKHIINIGDQYKCTICGKIFRSRQQQYYHIHCDEPEQSRPYKCGDCQRGFLKESHLKYHIKTHSPDKIFCDICKKQFSNKTTFDKHIKKHAQLKKYRCDICKMEYKDQVSFKFHINSHNETLKTNSIYCNICDKRFSIKSQLKRHAVIHKKDREKLFGCTVCNSKFFRASSLKDHVQKHTNFIKFKCDICCKNFTEEKALRRHTTLHDDSVIYQCQMCDTKVNRKDNLIRHVKNMHPDHNIKISSKLKSSTSLASLNTTNCKNQFIQNKNNTKSFVSSNGDLKQYEKDRIDLKNSIESINCLENTEVDYKKYIQCPVIKAVGNAKPLNVILSPKTTDKKLSKMVLNVNPINISVLANKKLKKKYDPAEIYRKILFVNSDDISTPCSANDIIQEEETDERNSKSGSKNKTLTVHSNDDTFNYPNFIEKHWRKNFYS